MEGALEVVLDAIECKVPNRIPTFCLGADWDFMERFYSDVGFTYQEFNQFKEDKLPWLCPSNIPLSIKLGVDLTWIAAFGRFTWLDDYSEIALMNGGRVKVTTRMSSYQPPKNKEKHQIPHWWWLKEGLTNKEAIRNFMEQKLSYPLSTFKHQKKVVEICEKKYNLIVSLGLTGPWENLHFGIGFGNIAKFWRKDRTFLHEINDFYSDYAIRGMKNLVKIAKPKVVMIGDDYGFNHGLQLSLEMWRELVKPTLIEHVKIVHDSGAKCLLHSCGNIGELFKDFIDIGINGVESLQPLNNDLIGLKQKYGNKLAFIGTIDDTNLLKYGTSTEIKESVTQSINDLGPHGYIPGATNFLLDQPPQNIIAMLDAIKEYKVKK